MLVIFVGLTLFFVVLSQALSFASNTSIHQNSCRKSGGCRVGSWKAVVFQLLTSLVLTIGLSNAAHSQSTYGSPFGYGSSSATTPTIGQYFSDYYGYSAGVGFNEHHTGTDMRPSDYTPCAIAGSCDYTRNVYPVTSGTVEKVVYVSGGTLCNAAALPASASYANHGLGNAVMVRHQDGKYSVYAHLDCVASYVVPGYAVTGTVSASPTIIGRMGHSATVRRSSFSVHLHIEIKNLPEWGSEAEDGSGGVPHTGYTPDFPFSYPSGYEDVVSYLFGVGNYPATPISPVALKVTSSAGANLRAGPSTLYSGSIAFSSIANGSYVVASGRTSDSLWYQVDIPGVYAPVKAWIAKSTVTEDGTAEIVQVFGTGATGLRMRSTYATSGASLAALDGTKSGANSYAGATANCSQIVHLWDDQRYVVIATNAGWKQISLPGNHYTWDNSPACSSATSSLQPEGPTSAWASASYLQTSTPTCTYTFNSSSAAPGYGATSGSVGVTTTSACAWTVASNATSWLTVTAGASGTGSGSVSYSVTTNPNTTPRTGIITLTGGQTFTVTQAGAPVTCTYTFNSSSAAPGYGATSGSVGVTTTSACAWTVASNATSWLTVTAGASGTGSGSVSYSVTTNPNTTPRTGIITLTGGQTFTVTQAGAPAVEVFPPNCQLPTGWTMPSGANAGWVVATDYASEGTCSLKAAPIFDSQKAQIQFVGTLGAGNVTFSRRVSSEATYDCFRFYVDGVQQNDGGACGPNGASGTTTGASGEVPWGAVSFPVVAGPHTLVWSYEKDTCCTGGSLDAAWIDAVVLPISSGGYLPVITQDPVNQTVNAGQLATFTAGAASLTLPITVQWKRTPYIFGVFTDIPGATSPTYSFIANTSDTGSWYVAVFTNSAGATSTVGAELTVNAAPAPAISFNPSSLTFPNQNVGTTGPVQVFTLTNTGNAVLNFTGISKTGDFVLTNGCTSGLIVGATCQLGLQFAPSAAGTRIGSLSVFSNATISPDIKTLSGIGLAVPAPVCSLTAAPASVRKNGTTVLTANCSAATSYSWTGGSCAGKTTATCTDNPTATTTYSVTGINSSGSNTAFTTVTVKKPVDLTPILMLLLD